MRCSPIRKQVEELGSERCSPQIAEDAFSLLDGRWKLVILYHLFEREVWRFSELERAIPRISQKMLAQQIRELERDAIVSRVVYAEVPSRVEYGLTDIGRKLRPALHELVKWAALRRDLLGFSEVEPLI